MNEIIIDNLAIGYKKKVVAEGLSATIEGGALTCLIGRNGLGKSTLLRTIAGFLPALGGKVTIGVGDDGGKENGRGCKRYDVATASKAALSRLVSVVLTEKVDVRNMSVFDIVAMGRMPYTNFFGTLKDNDRAVVNEALQRVGIESFTQRDISTLSDGERQKVMIAKALAQQTPVIILDEPTAFLDYTSKVETMKLLHNLANNMGKVVLASTHDLDIAIRTADRLITIGGEQGELRDVDKKALSLRLLA